MAKADHGSAQATLARAGVAEALVGVRSRIGGIGQEYEVVELIDGTTALVHAMHYDQRLPYPIDEIEADIAGVVGGSRYSKLVGQVRSIGPDGPKYEVVSVDDMGGAWIWIIPNDENDPYFVEDILLDPFAD